MTSQDQAGLLRRCTSDVFQNHLRSEFKRLWMVYRCQRRRNKNLIEIVLEGAAKLSLNNPLPAALLKIFSRRYHHQITDRTLESALRDRVSVERVLGREKLFEANFFVHSTDESVWKDYRDRFPAKYRIVVEEADKITRHEFDFLGSGPCYWGELIDWHLDPKSGYHWPKKFYTELFPVSTLTNDELPKEALEMHVDGQSFLLDDYRHLRTFGVNRNMRTRSQEKGYREELIAFCESISGSLDRRALWDEAVEVSRTALEVNRKVRSGNSADFC